MIGPIWHHIPFTNAGAVFEHGKGYANDVAAMPSLHAAFALLFSLYLWRLVPRWWRPLLALYPVGDDARARLLGRALPRRLRRRLGLRGLRVLVGQLRDRACRAANRALDPALVD